MESHRTYGKPFVFDFKKLLKALSAKDTAAQLEVDNFMENCAKRWQTNTTWRKRTCEGSERDADVSPVSPFWQISLDLCLVWFCGRCFVGVFVLVGFRFRGNLFSFFTHSSC